MGGGDFLVFLTFGYIGVITLSPNGQNVDFMMGVCNLVNPDIVGNVCEIIDG